MAKPPSSQPVIVLIPGAWHLPDAWNKVKSQLEVAGYEVYTPRLPTVVGPEPVNYSWRVDVAVVHDIVIPLFNEGRQAVIVGHSYGGIVATASVKDQSIADRQSRGLQGGFSAVVYICAFPVVERGDSLLSTIHGKYGKWITANQLLDKNAPSSIQVIRGLEPFYNDIPPDEAKKWCEKLLNQSQRSCEEPVDFCANDIKIPMTYLLCEEDKAVPIKLQEYMAAAIPAIKTRRCGAGHSPFLSQPDLTTEVIIEATRNM
ncbi:Alpha/beta hydrolase fold-1 [Xylaria cubensis]|nr:Alpha/beta hydrolase fold-1 [Xylaria cubensis]